VMGTVAISAFRSLIRRFGRIISDCCAQHSEVV